MSMDLVCRGAMVFLTTTRSVALLVCIVLGVCKFPTAMSMWQAGKTFAEIDIEGANLGLGGGLYEGLMMWATVRTSPFFGGSLELSERKKIPPMRLRALDYDR